MGIENLNRFHWMIIGAMVGVVLSLVWVGAAGNVEGLSSSDQSVFERDLLLKDAGGQPLVTGIVVHPQEFSPSDGIDVNPVTYKRLARDRKGNFAWKDKWFVASIPYRPSISGRITMPANRDSLTIQTYLDEIAKTNNFVKYRYGWWLVRNNAMLVGGMGGLVVIGGIWPTLLNIMLTAGLGPRKREPKLTKEEKRKAGSLWSYKSRPETDKPVRPQVTAQDRARLDRVADEYEKNLKAAGMELTSSAPTGKTDTNKPAEVRKLTATTLDTSTTKTDSDDETELKYKEYYPVVVHHHKHQDDDGHGAGQKPPANKK
jgi:hypothetical protein